MIGLDIVNSKTFWDPSIVEDEFKDLFNYVFIESGSLLRLDNIISSRSYALYSICKSLSDLDADFVECGTYLGSSAVFMASNCKNNLHLFDSWEGVSDITEFDNMLYKDTNFKCDVEKAKSLLSKYSNVNFYKGWIPDRFDEIKNKVFSVVHIDVDLYQPAKDSIEFFWPRIIPGGKMILDFHDGNSYGVKKATYDFFKNNIIEMYLTDLAVITK